MRPLARFAILDVNVYRINSFSLDKQQGNEFILTPNIKTQTNDIPVPIAESFSQEFLKGLVGQGRKIHGCYLAYSKSIKLFFRLIKKANDKPVTQRRDIFYNPQKYFKQELLKHHNTMEDGEIDDLIDATFKESTKWQSARIIELGVWLPKANCYLPDPENQNEWISKDLVSLQLKNGDDAHFIHARPTELGELLTNWSIVCATILIGSSPLTKLCATNKKFLETSTGALLFLMKPKK